MIACTYTDGGASCGAPARWYVTHPDVTEPPSPRCDRHIHSLRSGCHLAPIPVVAS